MSLPVAISEVITTKLSGLIFHWRAADLSLDPLTDQTATYAKTGATTACDDSVGTSYSAVDHQPTWHWDDGLEVTTLRMTTAGVEKLKWEMNILPCEMTVYLTFVCSALTAASGGPFLQIGHETTYSTAPYFRIDNGSGSYSAAHNNGSATRFVSISLSPEPSVGDGVEILAVLEADGGVSLEVSINGGAAQTDSAGTANALQSAWAGDYLHLGNVNGSLRTNADFRALKIAHGTRTLAQMRTAF